MGKNNICSGIKDFDSAVVLEMKMAVYVSVNLTKVLGKWCPLKTILKYVYVVDKNFKMKIVAFSLNNIEKWICCQWKRIK
jgi:ribosomal protein L7Ae-like RNA K-turn-binding protein